MAQLTVNGIEVEVAAPLSIQEELLTALHRTDDGSVRLSRHGDALEAVRVPIRTTLLTTDEKDALETELTAAGVASIGGDLFGTALSAYVIPQALVPGPLDDQWTWYFEIRGVGA